LTGFGRVRGRIRKQEYAMKVVVRDLTIGVAAAMALAACGTMHGGMATTSTGTDRPTMPHGTAVSEPTTPTDTNTNTFYGGTQGPGTTGAPGATGTADSAGSASPGSGVGGAAGATGAGTGVGASGTSGTSGAAGTGAGTGAAGAAGTGAAGAGSGAGAGGSGSN
jgi:collagen type I/II/III/V/XI/XXIV/XXVII alpha